MIIWAGFGYLVPIIVFATSLIAEIITEKITGDPHYYQTHFELVFIAMLVASACLYFLGTWLSARKAKKYIDTETGDTVIIKNNHTFFFIRIEYWGLIIPVISGFITIKEHFPPSM